MRNKYHAQKVEIDNIKFDSKAEGERYLELKLLLADGSINDLDIHPAFPLVVNEQRVCNYIADFRYHDNVLNRWVIEDVKGFKTPVYRLKKKLFAACYGMGITEVGLPFSVPPRRLASAAIRQARSMAR